MPRAAGSSLPQFREAAGTAAATTESAPLSITAKHSCEWHDEEPRGMVR